MTRARAIVRVPLTTCIVGTTLLVSASPCVVAQPAPRSLDAILAPVRAEARVPALGAAIVSSRGLIAIGAVGVRAQGMTARVDTTDQWHLGSCTKAMTAVLVARLVDRGVLRWESTVAELWPDRTRHASWDRVTVAQLLTHRGGMQANPDDSVWNAVARGRASLVDQRARLARALFAAPPMAPADSMTIYSNAAFIAVGALIERKTGRPWEALLRAEVFRPLGMRTAGFGVPGQAGLPTNARGHVEDSAGMHPMPWLADADNPAVTGPAGTVHASLPDWARFIATLLRGANGDTRYLSRAQWRRILQPADARADYALGWKRVADTTAAGFTLAHLGSNGFWIVQASLAPARGVAVLLTANIAVDRLEQPFAMLTHALGDSARVWCARAGCR
jgi:CubicO group peptidase (beta-lactamase class C family)